MGGFCIAARRRAAGALAALALAGLWAAPAAAAGESLEELVALAAGLDEQAAAWAQDKPGEDPTLLAVNYVCGGRYTDPLWGLILGGDDEDFNQAVAAADPALAALRSAGVVTAPGAPVDFVHMVIGAGAGYSTGSPQVICTWGGDCVQLAAGIRGEGTDLESCYARLAGTFAADDENASLFPLSDWTADLDGANLGQRLAAGETLGQALENYYALLADAADPDAERARLFVQAQFGGADTGDREAFRQLVWETFSQDAGVQLYLLAQEHASVDENGEFVFNGDMLLPLQAACRLVADRLSDTLNGAVVPPSATEAPAAPEATPGAETPAATPEAAGPWQAAMAEPRLLLAAAGALGVAFVLVLAALWALRKK